jgi:hypothetical protein
MCALYFCMPLAWQQSCCRRSWNLFPPPFRRHYRKASYNILDDQHHVTDGGEQVDRMTETEWPIGMWPNHILDKIGIRPNFFGARNVTESHFVQNRNETNFCWCFGTRPNLPITNRNETESQIGMRPNLKIGMRLNHKIGMRANLNFEKRMAVTNNLLQYPALLCPYSVIRTLNMLSSTGHCYNILKTDFKFS